MRNPLFALAIAFLCAASCLAQEPLSSNSVAIYRAFLTNYYGRSRGPINIIDETSLFGFEMGEQGSASCLKEAQLHATPSEQRHVLNRSIIPDGMTAHFIPPEDRDKSLRDPGDAIRSGGSVDDAVKKGVEAAVITLSEIVFDANHTHAILSYSFVCGNLCGNGGAVRFQKNSHGVWVESNGRCGEWVS